MPNIPTPIRAALGLAATAVDEARKLPETLPQAVTTVPLMAVSTAMQASMKLQQHLATLAARGDEVLSQLRGSSAEPPSWATFDDDSPVASAGSIADDPQSGKAAFDLIDYDNTGFADGLEDDPGRWDAVGVGGAEAPEAQPGPLRDADLRAAGADDFDVTATPPSAAGPTPPAPDLADAVSAPDPGPAKAAARGGAGRKAAAKAGPAKASPAKASPAKAGPAKAGPAKASPAKAAKRAARKEPDHEPLEVAARKAKPSPTPNPATMAAEILQAHEAAADDE